VSESPPSNQAEVETPHPPSFKVYNYPNPAYGNTTTIRIELENTAKIKLQIYNLISELVFEKQIEGHIGINEVLWDISDAARGIYLLRAETIFPEETKIVIKKIGIVKKK
jgi:hypothetical protein